VDAEEVLDAGVDVVVLVVGAADVVVGAGVVVLDAGVAEVELVDGVVDAPALIKVWLNACMMACIKCEPFPERPARLPPSSSPP